MKTNLGITIQSLGRRVTYSTHLSSTTLFHLNEYQNLIHLDSGPYRPTKTRYYRSDDRCYHPKNYWWQSSPQHRLQILFPFSHPLFVEPILKKSFSQYNSVNEISTLTPVILHRKIILSPFGIGPTHLIRTLFSTMIPVLTILFLLRRIFDSAPLLLLSMTPVPLYPS